MRFGFTLQDSPRNHLQDDGDGSDIADEPFEDESAAILGDDNEVEEESEGEDLFRDDMERDYR